MNDWVIPEWPAPNNVKAIFTTRNGGVSRGLHGDYTSLNLANHVKDNPIYVERNRALLGQILPSEPKWLKQVHGPLPVWVSDDGHLLEGDAALSCRNGTVCVVLVADCLPVFLCDTAGTVVSIIHAGWRGLASGIIEKSVLAMRKHSHSRLIAWLGPAIGPNHFEVGEEVREAFVQHDRNAALAFMPRCKNHRNKWLADLFLLARQRLAEVGVTGVYGGGVCTFSDPTRFFSYRRDGETGRMAALIWLEA